MQVKSNQPILSKDFIEKKLMLISDTHDNKKGIAISIAFLCVILQWLGDKVIKCLAR
jgi:hypothetical protein